MLSTSWSSIKPDQRSLNLHRLAQRWRRGLQRASYQVGHPAQGVRELVENEHGPGPGGQGARTFHQQVRRPQGAFLGDPKPFRGTELGHSKKTLQSREYFQLVTKEKNFFFILRRSPFLIKETLVFIGGSHTSCDLRHRVHILHVVPTN